MWTLYDLKTESRRKARITRSLEGAATFGRQHGGISTAETVLFLVERGDRVERRSNTCSRGNDS